MRRFNLKKLKATENKEKYQVKISNRFATLENLDVDVDSKRAWEMARISKFQPKRFWVIMN
jgi:hypothetical protein